MIAIFSLLGLVLFGGGLYAIYDGWPYLVLERGFTEVIIGSIAATGGLILLSLAWVLKQLKALRAELAEAAEARASVAAPVEAAMPAVPRETATTGETPASWSVGSAAVGAGAVGIGAAAVAAAVAEKHEPAAADSETLGRDLFGALVADHLAEPEEEKEQQDEAPEPVRDEAVPDMFETETAETVAADVDHPAAGEEESHDPAEIVAAKTHPSSQDEILADHGEEAEPAAQDVDADEAGFEDGAPGAEEQGAAKEVAERDEFAALRESLTSQLGSLHRPAGRIEPSLAPEEDPFAEAEAWISPSNERREPSFDAPRSAIESGAEPPLPVWPPRTEPQDSSAVASKVPEPSHEAAASGQDRVDFASDRATPLDDAEPDEPEQPESDEGQTEDAAPAPKPAAQEPASSDEGIVGAYQVGETHFTIYADGSIRARTPDGEYSFASMDELKVYLASEKSRLGV